MTSNVEGTVYVQGMPITITSEEYVDDADNLGECVLRDSRITLKERQALPCMRDTLLHEVIHAIDGSTSGPNKRLSENQVVRMTSGLLAALTDPRNRDFVAFILGNQDGSEPESD